MHRTLAIIEREMRRFRRSPMLVIMAIMMPVVQLVVLGYAFGGTYKALLLPQPKNTLAWAQALVDGSVAPVKPVAPVMIYWGTRDTAVPPVMGKLYQDQMCKLGGNVGRVQLEGEQTHYTTPGTASPLFVPWIKDRFEGKPATNGCPPG